ncbi:MAG: hypothetical protein KAI95_20665, partial [Bacteroidales bacterium]|nr:hypothetical protein [Bacteroidales bacterium]
EGEYKVRPGYYFYKQITRAGQPGMKVVQASAMDSELSVIAFTSNGTMNPDAFIVTNINNNDQKVKVWIRGSKAKSFEAFRTTKSPGSELDDIDEKHLSLGVFLVEDGAIVMDAPAGSITTFFAK